MEKLVSIIMPVYNGEAYISEAIRSVLDQSYTHWQLIIIDDGSKDDTYKIASSFVDSRICYYYQENRGQAAALNHGLELVTGDYVTTLDADDWFTVDSLLDRVDYLDHHPEFDAVYGDGIYCNEQGKPLKRFSDYRMENLEGDLYEVLIVTSFFGTGSPVMVSRSTIEKLQLRYDESIIWCQDSDFYIRLAETARFGFVDSTLVYYRMHAANMTKVIPEGRRLESLIRMKQKVLTSPRFINVSVKGKSDFFYYFLIDNLQGQSEFQKTVISNFYFCSLPNNEKSKLLRLMASGYILEGRNVEMARALLSDAIKLTPTDLKALLLTTIYFVNQRLARNLITHWRANQKNTKLISPMEIENELSK